MLRCLPLSCVLLAFFGMACSSPPEEANHTPLQATLEAEFACGPTVESLPPLGADDFDSGGFADHLGEIVRVVGNIEFDDSGCQAAAPEVFLRVSTGRRVHLSDTDPIDGWLGCEVYEPRREVTAWGRLVRAPDGEALVLEMDTGFDAREPDIGGHCPNARELACTPSGGPDTFGPGYIPVLRSGQFAELPGGGGYLAADYFGRDVQIVGRFFFDPATCNSEQPETYLQVSDEIAVALVDLLAEFREGGSVAPRCDTYAPGQEVTVWGELQFDEFGYFDHEQRFMLLLGQDYADAGDAHCAQHEPLACGPTPASGAFPILTGDEFDEFGEPFFTDNVQLVGTFVRDCDNWSAYLRVGPHRVRLNDMPCDRFLSGARVTSWGRMNYAFSDHELVLENASPENICLTPREPIAGGGAGAG